MPAPDCVKVSALALLAWWLKLRGADKVFGATPGADALNACAERFAVAQLEAIRLSLVMARARHGPLDSAPFLAMAITPKGSATVLNKVRIVFFEGKCGVGVHTFAEAMRPLAGQQLGGIFADAEMVKPNFTAEIVDEVRPAGAGAAPPNSDVSTTVVAVAGLVVTNLNEQQPDELVLAVFFNKHANCHQVINIVEGGRIVKLCWDECDEAAAADAARRIIIRSAMRLVERRNELVKAPGVLAKLTQAASAAHRAALPDALGASPVCIALDAPLSATTPFMPPICPGIFESTAIGYVFHQSASHETRGAAQCCGRRGVPCGESDTLSTTRMLPQHCRDGVCEALALLGVTLLALAALPHLGWVLASTRLAKLVAPPSLEQATSQPQYEGLEGDHLLQSDEESDEESDEHEESSSEDGDEVEEVQVGDGDQDEGEGDDGEESVEERACM